MLYRSILLHFVHLLFTYYSQGKSKYRSAAVFQAILTPYDGQYRPKHVVYRRQSENEAQLVIKVLKLVLYFTIEF
jgi:hypothetical protein